MKDDLKARAHEIAENAGIDMLDDHDLFIEEMTSALAAVRAEATLAMDTFGYHHNWSLQYVAKVYADDNKPEFDHWAVFEENGSINDREWTEIGAGATPHEAISSALRAAPQAPLQRSGDGTEHWSEDLPQEDR